MSNYVSPMPEPEPGQTGPSRPDMGILENRWLHKVFLFFTWFETAPLWVNLGWLSLLLAGHLGIWWRVAPARAAAMTLLLAGFIGLDAGLLGLLPRLGRSYGRLYSQLLVMVLPRLAVMGLAWLLVPWWPAWSWWISLALQTAGTLAYGWGMWIEPHRLALTTLKVAMPGRPVDSPPIRLLHLSDIHLERLTGREARLLQLIEQAQADLIVITGDYLNLSYAADPQAMAQVRQLLGKIEAPYGVYATLGSPPVDLPEVAPAHFDHLPIRLLRQEAVELDLGPGRRLRLLGLDCTHDMAYDAHRLAALAPAQADGLTTLLLYHSPELMPVAQQYPIDLFLCGHTHGGQVRIPGYGAVLTSSCTGKRYEMGRYDENGTTLYVSRGIGLEGMCAPRIRLFCPPEVTLVLLG